MDSYSDFFSPETQLGPICNKALPFSHKRQEIQMEDKLERNDRGCALGISCHGVSPMAFTEWSDLD